MLFGIQNSLPLDDPNHEIALVRSGALIIHIHFRQPLYGKDHAGEDILWNLLFP